MLSGFIELAKKDEEVFITDVAAAFANLVEKQVLKLSLEQINGSHRDFTLYLPMQVETPDEQNFIADYIFARIYNILSSLGGRRMALYYDSKIDWLEQIIEQVDSRFCIKQSRKERTAYGKSINVLDRMLEHIDDGAEKSGFVFLKNPKIFEATGAATSNKTSENTAIERYKTVVERIDTRLLCGLDVGGTDIKVAASDYGKLVCLKEYDWFPADFTVASQMIDPILWLVRLVRVQLSLFHAKDIALNDELQGRLEAAFDKDCLLQDLMSTVVACEEIVGNKLLLFDGIGLSFPDVVVQNKVVGGEVYKTRGMRDNPEIDYELEFAKITDLDIALRQFVKTDSGVQLTNDGPMAAFTAAVEQVFSERAHHVADGVFAHTLGTELGTGWINEAGIIPDIPLEVYNFIIDIGSYAARAYHADDIRSINNFNTGLSGTLQKYTSQSGAFRLASKTFQTKRPELWQEILDLAYVVKVEREGVEMYVCPTDPVDMRKPFLQHLMDLASHSQDEVCEKIFSDIGRYLAVTWSETELILSPQSKPRTMFGRLVKNQKCFELLEEGAQTRIPDIQFEVADGSMAYTPLMQQLEADPHYTVAQFAQAVGAIYFGDFQNK